MRIRFNKLTLLLGGLFVAAACNSSDTVQPPPQAPGTSNTFDLVPDFATASATVIDGAGIGAADLPDGIQLTVEQKVKIEDLLKNFGEANQPDFKKLADIEARANAAAKESDKSSPAVQAILAEAVPIRAELDARFEKLQADVWAIYTPAQQAWITANRPNLCGANKPPELSEQQVVTIRQLRGKYEVTYGPSIKQMKKLVLDAAAARAAGKPDSTVNALLAQADSIKKILIVAAKKLETDILAVLTPEQKIKWCLPRRLHDGKEKSGG